MAVPAFAAVSSPPVVTSVDVAWVLKKVCLFGRLFGSIWSRCARTSNALVDFSKDRSCSPWFVTFFSSVSTLRGPHVEQPKGVLRFFQGVQALARPNLWRKLPLLAVSMFVVGMGLETAMCLSGFYSVYTVNEAKKKAEDEIREEEFWQRVKARRAARQGEHKGKDNRKTTHLFE